MPQLFVYGTLKRGECNHPLLAHVGARYAGVAHTTRPYALYEIDGELYRHPAMAQRPGRAVVRGELYDVQRFRLIDALEHHPTHYVRRRIVVKQGAQKLRAWTYFIRPQYFQALERDGRVRRAVAGIWASARGSGSRG